MIKTDIKRKLCSRKFWAAVVGFITPLLLIFGMPENTVAQVAAIITSGGTLIAYIIGEGLVDAAREGKEEHLYLEDAEDE